eukprot:7432998-Prorocentrum_lima.AAC.1
MRKVLEETQRFSVKREGLTKEAMELAEKIRTLLSPCMGEAAAALPGDLAQSLEQAAAHLDK